MKRKLLIFLAATAVAAGSIGAVAVAGTTVRSSASGKVTLVPDVARVQLGVTIARPTVKAARDAGAKAMTDILATIKSLGIADKGGHNFGNEGLHVDLPWCS